MKEELSAMHVSAMSAAAAALETNKTSQELASRNALILSEGGHEA